MTVPKAPSPHALYALPPLALYVHIPWCVRKCPYCDFNSHERAGALPEHEYVARLMLDLEGLLPSVWGRRLVSVFIGGGTPSLFSPEAIDTLLAGVRARMTLEPGAEITLEANPGTVEAARFRGFREAGVNRISIGVQSFDGECSPRSDASTVRTRRGARSMPRSPASTTSTSTSCTACPGRARPWRARTSRKPRAAACRTSRRTSSRSSRTPRSGAGRRSCRSTISAPTCSSSPRRFSSGAATSTTRPPPLRSPLRRCQHNLNYWEFGDYLGIGAGAHGKISFPDRITRHERAKQPAEYLKASAAVEQRVIPAADLPFEFMLNALRLIEGFPPALFEERTGLPFPILEKQLQKAEDKELAGARLEARAADRARAALPQRAAGAFPRRRNTRSRTGCPRRRPRDSNFVTGLAVKPAGAGSSSGSRENTSCMCSAYSGQSVAACRIPPGSSFAPPGRRIPAAPCGACGGASSARDPGRKDGSRRGCRPRSCARARRSRRGG